MFKKLMVALMTLALMVGIVLPASADVNITGSLGFRLNSYDFTTAPGLNKADFEGRLWLTLKGSVNDFITYRADVYIGYSDLAKWQSPAVSTTTTTIGSDTVVTGVTLDTQNLLRLNRAFITANLVSKGIPLTIEGGYLNISTYSPLTVYGDSFNIGNVPGVNIISSALFPGLTTFLLLSPDVATTADNQKAVALGANLDGSWGRVTGIVWTRDDETSTGYRVSGKWNVVPNLLTLYALYGQRAGDTEAKYQVVGINLPGVKTDTGWDPYLEYDVYNKALGFYAGKTLTTNVSTSIYIWQDASTKNLKFTPYLTFSF